MDCRFVPITDEISIPIPVHASKEEEERLVAKFKAENNLEELTNEYRELKDLVDHPEKAVPLEQLL